MANPILENLRENTPNEILQLVDHAWKNKKYFFKWPSWQLVLIPGCVRQKYHQFDQATKDNIKSYSINIDSRSNGPAIMAFLAAGGERPYKEDGKGWPIHHIYDGNHCYPSKDFTTHAVKDGYLFTNSAGLVAIHPTIEGLAHESSYMAWLLRNEAYLRFNFDPDSVFPCFSNQSKEIEIISEFALRFSGYKFADDSNNKESISSLTKATFEGENIEVDSLEPLDRLCLLFHLQRALRHVMPDEGLENVYDTMRRIFLSSTNTEIPDKYKTEYTEKWELLYQRNTERYSEQIERNLKD